MITRRTLIGTGTLIAGLHAAHAQAPRWRIGILAVNEPAFLRPAIEKSLERKWPGSAATTIFLEKDAGSDVSALPRLARELIEARVDLIVARFTPAAVAALSVTSTLPIVATVGAATETGIAASLANPGRNITGVSSLAPETIGKLVEIAGEMFPGARRFGFLSNAVDPLTPFLVESVMHAARQAGREVLVEAVTGTSNLDAAIARLVGATAAAVIVQPSLPVRAAIARVHAAGVPALGVNRAALELGALASYASPISETPALLAELVVQVLSGAKPADIPIRQPTRFELAINLKVAAMLGLTLPPAIIARADEVIE